MKKLFTIAVAAVLLFGITALVYGAAPEKATGGVEIPLKAWKASFNAHEGPPAKGQLQFSSNIAGRSLHCVVKYVNVDPTTDTAWFAAKCTYDSNAGAYEGRWVFVKVLDGGTPGTAGDYIGWDWTSADETIAAGRVASMAVPLNWWNVTKGNLVVHP